MSSTIVADKPAAIHPGLISPHGGGGLVDLVVRGDEAHTLREHAATLPQVRLTDKQAADLEMMAVGAMSPITGFLGKADYDSVVENIRLADGSVWSIPITLAVDERPAGDEITLISPDGLPLATMEITEAYSYDKQREAKLVYRTTEDSHPGVKMLYDQGDTLLAGPVKLFDFRPNLWGDHLKTPVETRKIFADRGWTRVVGFQTRNPVHRAHEYIIKTALEAVDGLLLHPLVGRTKEGDVPAEVRMQCYDVLLQNYFPADRYQWGVFPAAMRYAGPREAIFHAMCRKNYGCSHFIVGRDHAGVQGLYGTYDAQRIFEQFTPDELGITIFGFEHAFFCTKCEAMATAKTCPHGNDDHIFLSGTKVREMLGRGEMPPREFSRPEVAEILIAAYRDGAAAS